ncbi:MAG: hypothetical protein J4F28_08705 [Nitrosopumilaceae archaeon]|nr:hypothetical protein [Nitrosopumilaceae archaeon]
MPRWHISNKKMPRGQLADVKRLIHGPERPSARSVIVPIESDRQEATGVAGGLAGDQIRSFEMWWDASESKLRFVMIADERDADDFERAFQVMYPNSAFDDICETVPTWFDRRSTYRVFDVGTRHGHYATVFDEPGGEHGLITRMASAIQSASHAWIQFVFARLDCTPFLRTHMSRLDNRFMEINRGNYTSWGDEITGKKPRKHPELGYDLTSSYKGLKKHVMAKMQGAHLIMSIRGLVQGSDSSDDGSGGGKDIDLPFDKVSALSVDGIDSAYEHLAKFRYKYDRFFSDVKGSRVRVPGPRGARDHRICMFESRHLPDPDQFFGRAISQYFDKGWWGLRGYQARRPMPFLILNPAEIPLFVHLPDPSTPNIDTTRGVRLPSKPSEKTGAGIGFFDSLDDPKQQPGPAPEDADGNCGVR